MLKYILGVPVLIAVPTAVVGYQKRKANLEDPVLKRALQHIRNDQRIIDFCGEDVNPGWIISKKVGGGADENWVKFDFNVKGLSGKLKTTVIGDYLSHAELLILEGERQEYLRQKEALAKQAAEAAAAAMEAQKKKEEAAKKSSGGFFGGGKKQEPAPVKIEATLPPKEEVEAKKKAAAEEYIPVDFDAYSIADKATLEKRGSVDPATPVDAKEKLWRISSLTTFVDADTKILLLPLPESKRKVKIQDTLYDVKTYGELLARNDAVSSQLAEAEKKNVRFEDKTSEEISQDIRKKRRVQMQKLNQIRTWQFLGLAGLLFGYLFVYRRFFAAKSVMNSAIYHQTLTFIR